jgi:periplasmic protein TonB
LFKGLKGSKGIFEPNSNFTNDMAAEHYYVDREDNKHNYFGILGTTLVHGIIFAVLFLTVLYPPDPPLEFQGMQMNLGEENMGGPSNTNVPEPATTESYVPISEQTEETPPITSEDPESVDVKTKPEKKPNEVVNAKIKVEEKKPQLELPKKVNEAALFKRKTNTNTGEGGRGDGEIPGNQGEPDGVDGGDPHGHGLGESGFGTGETGPDGISFELSGRKVKQLPEIEDHSKSVGKVVVRIVVNREGKVIKAVPGQVGSTTTEIALLNKAKEGAMKTKFSSREDGPDEQYGSMTFVFRFRP